MNKKNSNMKPIHCLSLLLVIVLGLSSCVSVGSTTIPTQADAPLPSLTLLSPTSISTLTPTETSTATPLVTLEPEQVKETIRILLQEPVDCEAPCFWGIVPGQTTLSEAKNIFIHLGLQIKSTTYQGKDFFGIEYDFDGGPSFSVILTVQNEIVENLRIKMLPEMPSAGAPRKWFAYSPEALIERYGTPSKVDFFLGGAAPDTSYAMDMYFDSKNLIIEYYSYDLGSDLQICPLIDQMSSVRIWMGEDPVNPPSDSVPLEKATSLTMEEFTQLLTRDLNTACFNLNVDAF